MEWVYQPPQRGPTWENIWVQASCSRSYSHQLGCQQGRSHTEGSSEEAAWEQLLRLRPLASLFHTCLQHSAHLELGANPSMLPRLRADSVCIRVCTPLGGWPCSPHPSVGVSTSLQTADPVTQNECPPRSGDRLQSHKPTAQVSGLVIGKLFSPPWSISQTLHSSL